MHLILNARNVYKPLLTSSCVLVGCEVHAVISIQESMELLPDGRKMRRTTETLTKFTKTGDGNEEEEVRSIQVVENVTILGLGVEEPYDEDDVIIEVATEQSEQVMTNGVNVR